MIKLTTLKKPTPANLEDINLLLSQLSPEDKRLNLANLHKLLGDANNRFFVAKAKGKIIGMATLVLIRTPSGLRGWIEDVVVDADYRRQGIGARLCKAAIAAARKEKARNIKLTSRPSRVAANKLYKNLGFRRKITNVYKMDLR